jgi:uncharacterized protein YndB with AHSA1/START domain
MAKVTARKKKKASHTAKAASKGAAVAKRAAKRAARPTPRAAKKAGRPKATAASRKAVSKPKATTRQEGGRGTRTAPPSSRRGAKRTAPEAGPDIEAGPTELDTIKLAYLFRDTTPAAIYHALMDAAEHSRFTGDVAEIDARVGGVFRSYRGFIHGTTLEFVPDARIVQSWRTKHFPKNNPSSRVELAITPVAEGTRLDLRHIDVPKPQVEYIVSGWVRFYLDPLARHLGKRVSLRPPPV